jgi:hypothetical protein
MSDEAVRYRVTRDGAEVLRALPPGFRSADYDPPAPTITWLRGPADAGVTAALAGTAADTLTRIGLSPVEVPFAVVWSGGVPAADSTSTRLSLLTATLPSGATYTEARLTLGGARGGQVGALCGSELRAAGGQVTEQVFAVVCGDVGALVVVAPQSAIRAQVLDAAGRQVDDVVLERGAAVLPVRADAAAVRVLGSGGDVLDEQPVMGYVDLSRK